MRKVTATEKLRAVNEGSMSKKEFVRQMRQEFPTHITQFNGFDDSIQILKNRGVIYEVKEEVVEAHVYDERPILNYSLDALDRAIRIELEANEITTYGGSIKPEDFYAAEKKAKANLEKNPTHYLDLMSGESNKVDKHDKMKETKRGAEDTDVFNALKKATLKEGYTEEQIEAAIQKIRERKAGEHEDGTPKSNDEMGDDEREDFYNDLDSVDETEEEYLAKKDAAIKQAMDTDVEETVDIVKEAGKTALIQTMNSAIEAIKGKYGEMPGIAGIIRDFLKTHIDDLAGGADPLDEFENYVDANYDSLSEEETVGEKYDREDGDGHIGTNTDDDFEREMHQQLAQREGKGKDHDGDGDIDSDDYMHAKDKAIKKATGKDEQLKEAVKTLIRKALTEESINEAATAKLADWGASYEGMDGVKPVVNELENIVTEIEQFHDRMKAKIQKAFEKTSTFANEEGLKVGAFIAPSLEAAFRQDLRPVVKAGYTGNIELPKVRRVTQADVTRNNSGEEPLGEVELERKQTIYTPNI